MKEALKNKKVRIGLVVGAVILVFLLFVILWNASRSSDNKNDSVSNFPTSIPNSHPSSYLTGTIKSDSPVIEEGSYKFVNSSEFEYVHIENLYADCGGDYATPKAQVDVSRYNYKSSNSSYTSEYLNNIHVYVFENMSKYLDNDKDILKAYENLNKVLDGDMGLDSKINSSSLTSGFYKVCTGNGSIPLGYIEKINYKGTDNAYLLIFYGSNQSVVDQHYFPVEIMIISNIDNDYSITTIFTEYSNLTRSNSLDDCEGRDEESSYPVSYVNIFDTSVQKCVQEAMKKDLDKSKIDEAINFYTTKFELQ